VIFQPEVLAAMREHTLLEAPNECLGLLIGIGDRVLVALPLRNALCAPGSGADPRMRCEPDPDAVRQAYQRAENLGLGVLSWYHSHTEGRIGKPSKHDVENHPADEDYMVIVESHPRRGGGPNVRLWHIPTMSEHPVIEA
jgi:proteasome lid subunit RPN8/RPN11